MRSKSLVAKSDQQRKYVLQELEKLKSDQKEILNLVTRLTVQLTQLQSSLFVADSVVQQAHRAMIITDDNSFIIRVNQAFTEITGYSEKEVIGKKPSIFSSGRHASPYYNAMWTALEQEGWWSGEIWNRRKNGEVYPQRLNITRIYDEVSRRKLYVAIFSDISNGKEQELRLDRMAHYDVLTGLPNRSLFMGLAEHSVNRSKRYSQKMALLFIDLDKFKDVNDEFGHHQGDRVLTEAAQRINHCIRDSDLVARMGADEFVVILENTHRSHAKKVANALIETFIKPFDQAGHQHRLGASIGMVFYPDHGDNVDDLLRRADAAMSQAKEKGRNQVVEFEMSIEQLNLMRNETEKMIWKAISDNRIRVMFQPVISTETLQTVSLEALVRIESETGEMISPVTFIPAAEQSGLIRILGQEVFRKCCEFAVTLREQHCKTPRIFVNLSAKQMQDSDLYHQLVSITESFDLKLSDFGFEITESTAMEDLQIALRLMEQLRRAGSLFSLDDFGTGYASLGYLSDLPLDVVKLDRSFITEITDKPVSQAIVRAVVDIASHSGLTVTAEGVETQAQCEMVQALKVTHIQGYYFSRPLSEADTLKWLTCKP